MKMKVDRCVVIAALSKREREREMEMRKMAMKMVKQGFRGVGFRGSQRGERRLMRIKEGMGKGFTSHVMGAWGVYV